MGSGPIAAAKVLLNSWLDNPLTDPVLAEKTIALLIPIAEEMAEELLVALDDALVALDNAVLLGVFLLLGMKVRPTNIGV